MKNKHLIRLVTAAVFTAMIFAATAYLPRLPILGGAGGYLHFGDAFIYIAASLLPAPYAVAAASIGASLADAMTGFMFWAPGTLIIKAMMALPFSLLRRKNGKIITVRGIMASVAAGIICIAGYYLYEALIISNFIAALESVPFNIVQAVLSSVIFIAAGFALDRTGVIRLTEPGTRNTDKM